jgi:hypothetical protein
MHGRIILSFSAVVLFVGGGAAMFAPQELAPLIGLDASRGLPMAIQLIGSGLLGFAVVNWMSRRNRIGGIYARPIAMGNLLFFTTGALTIGKATTERHVAIGLIVLCAVFALFAVSFAWLAFAHDPLSGEPGNSIA